MNGEIIIIMCEISHTSNCTELNEWQIGEINKVLGSILGGLAFIVSIFMTRDGNAINNFKPWGWF